MILSRSCQHAIRAILRLAVLPEGTFALVKDVADQEGIPQHFLGKICQSLAQDGLLISAKGRNGGFALAKPARTIRVLDIVIAVDGRQRFSQCLMGLPECTDSDPCPMHHRWTRIRDQVDELLAEETLETLTGRARRSPRSRRTR